MDRPRVILFDLGGVLFDYAPARRLDAIAAACRTDLDTVADFVAGVLPRDLDIGLASLTDLARGLNALADGKVGEEEAASLWLSVFSPNPDVWPLIEPLSRDYALGAFSDNPPFIRRLLPPQLDAVFLSSEIGALKPDPRAFTAVEQGLALPPDQILFIDDTYRNVLAARDRGWTAVHYRDPESLLRALRRDVLT